MANPYFERPSSVAAGTTIRSDKYNSDLDVHQSAFDSLHDTLQRALFLPATFTGNATIPDQTVNDTFIYIDASGDIALYPIATILEQFGEVNAKHAQINAWQQQVAGNAIDAQDAAALSLQYSNASSVSASNSQDSANDANGYATDSASSAQLSDNFANYEHNSTIPTTGGKYSAYHWAKEAEAYAQQTLDTVNGDFVPASRTVNSKELSSNIVLNAADVSALPDTTTVNDIGGVPETRTVNGKALSSNITLNASDVDALPDSTTLATLGGVPLTRQVNGKALNANITLDADDVNALSSSTTLATLGGVPTSRQVNGKALTGNITLNANDVNAIPNTQSGSRLTRVTGGFTATKLAGVTEYVTEATGNTTCTINDGAFSANDKLIITKQRQSGQLTLTASIPIYLPDGTSATSHHIPDGYACTIELVFTGSAIRLKVYN